jgi:hypothetical protein
MVERAERLTNFNATQLGEFGEKPLRMIIKFTGKLRLRSARTMTTENLFP